MTEPYASHTNDSRKHGLVTPKGYHFVEKHKVLTRDGFLLTNFQFPYGRWVSVS